MDSNDYIPSLDLDEEPHVQGASSTEDFWMFFSFAMILLVFVLMNYVNYLYSMVVKTEDGPLSPPEIEQTQAPGAQSQVDIRVYVKQEEGRVYYVFSDDEQHPLDEQQLSEGLSERVEEFEIGKPVQFYVHAPGDVLYQHVFDAAYPAWKHAQENPNTPLNVHFVYEAEPQSEATP